MKALAPLAIIVIAVLLYFSLDPVERDRRADAAYYAQQQSQIALERERLALDLQRNAAERAEWRAANLSPVWLVAGGLLIVLGVVTCGLVVGATFDTYKQRRTPLVRADDRGLYPLARPALVEGTYDPLVQQVAILAQQVRALAAVHTPGQTPAALTYSPHIATTRHNDAPPLLPPPALAEETESLDGNVFADLLTAGKIGRGNPLHLGISITTGKALIGSWLDLYSTAVAGLPGTGKTTSQRFLACQTALHGARFAVVDPHMGASEDSLATTLAPLSSVYLCEPASTDRAILEVVRLIADIGQRRVSGKDNDHTPIVLWVDELTALLGRSSVADDLAELLERIAQEFRKRGIYLCASGQIWTASRATSELRDSFASVLCHRMKRNQARLLLPTDEAETVERLSTGQAVLWRTSGEAETVIIPNTTASDVQRVANLLATPGSKVINTAPAGNQDVATFDPLCNQNVNQNVTIVDTSTDQLHSAPVSAEAARAAALFMGGASMAQIVRELRGDLRGGSYQRAVDEIQALVRAGLAGLVQP